jgi:hypothetical protein
MKILNLFSSNLLADPIQRFEFEPYPGTKNGGLHHKLKLCGLKMAYSRFLKLDIPHYTLWGWYSVTVTYEGHACAYDPGIAIMRIHKKRSIF